MKKILLGLVALSAILSADVATKDCYILKEDTLGAVNPTIVNTRIKILREKHFSPTTYGDIPELIEIGAVVNIRRGSIVCKKAENGSYLYAAEGNAEKLFLQGFDRAYWMFDIANRSVEIK